MRWPDRLDRKPPDPNIFFLTLSKIADLPTPFRVSAESKKKNSALSELKNIEYLFYFLYCFKKIPKLCFISLKICGKYANFANRKSTLTTRYRVLASKFPQIFIFVKREIEMRFRQESSNDTRRSRWLILNNKIRSFFINFVC